MPAAKPAIPPINAPNGPPNFAPMSAPPAVVSATPILPPRRSPSIAEHRARRQHRAALHPADARGIGELRHVARLVHAPPLRLEPDVAEAREQVLPSGDALLEVAQHADASLRRDAATASAPAPPPPPPRMICAACCWLMPPPNAGCRPGSRLRRRESSRRRAAEHRHRADAQQAAQPAQHPAATARPRAAARERDLLAGEHLHQHGRDARRDHVLDGGQDARS